MESNLKNITSKIEAGASQIAAIQRRPWFTNLVWQIGVPVAFLIVVMFFFPIRERFELSSDEGINLMKGMLVEKGYSLYSEIWSDQPPLFTYLLSTSFHLFGYKAGAGRLVVLILSCLLLWAAFRFLEISWGRATAIAGVILIALIPKYMILSVAAMVGLPAIAFAVISCLALALWHTRRQKRFLILSAIALGLSVLTKLFTGFLAPIFVVGLVAGEFTRFRAERSWWKLLMPAILWGAAFGIFTLGLGLLFVGPENVWQLVDNHVAGEANPYFRRELFTITSRLRQSWPILLLALVGTVMAIRARKWLTLYLVAWTVAAYGLLYFHRPVWDHQQLLVTVPAAMLASIAVAEAIRWIYPVLNAHLERSPRGLLQAAALVGLLCFVFVIRTPEAVRLMNPIPSLSGGDLGLGPLKSKFLYKMIEFAPETHWVVTDIPMYAFRARLPVPPNLVVFSEKRFTTGFLTEDEVIEAIRQYDPEQVLLGRRAYPRVESFLAGRYRMIHTDGNSELYLRTDLGG